MTPREERQVAMIERGATIFLCVAAVAGALTLAIVAAEGSSDQRSRSDQVMDQCREEFESEGNEQVDACAVKVMTRDIQQREADKLERAAR